MNYIRIARLLFSALALSVTSLVLSNANADSIAFDTGYQKAAWLLCPNSVIYNDAGFSKFMDQDMKYTNTREYERGFAALKAGIKRETSKVCFAAARAGGWWTRAR
ncbi:hypothetical protein [Mesorhizobium sp. L48C026A00]|uniref:hypothetical protein n=1 Tax=Mesorhizobium sp. L48C026A00 TaxID=1287182 RepID=UPI0003D05DCE|nr:hypothetical protein [Mesorhizobium sp. L48C026A00]ESZ15232.1 hypothetical protein X737_22130 [Mesorhizobium sp. L48C026A00]